MVDQTAPGLRGSGGRIFYGWWIIGAAIVGLSSAPSQFAFGALGLFIVPLGEEYGWDRAEISLALTFFTGCLAVCLPFVGRLADRIGSRRMLVPTMVICGLLLAAIPLVVSQLWHLLVIFALIGAVGAGANTLPYMLTISAWFDRRRGLAMGLAMAGGGLSFAYVPPLVQFLIDTYGWRSGYFVLSAIAVLFAAPVVGLIFRDSPAEKGLQPDGDPEPPSDQPSIASTGMSLSASLRRREFWLLWTVFFLLSFSLYGLLPHIVPMLTDRGMQTGKAALASSTVGVTIIVARVVVGFLIDRIFAPRVAVVFFLLTAIGIGVLAGGAAGPWAFVAAVLIGLSMGAELDLLAFLTSRYFGLRHFGAVFGVMFAALLVGTSAGPVSYGAAYELTGSYVKILILCAALTALSAMIMLLLRPYPDFSRTV
jgi:MFS family permease